MRILMTTDTIGGVWTFTRELSEGLLQVGHAVALVSFGRAPSPEQSAWAESTSGSFGERFEYRPSRISLEWMQENEQALSAGSELLLKLADQFKPEVLHSNQYCFGSLPIDVPKLITAHSDVMSWAAACRQEGLNPSAWLDRYCVLVQHGLDGADAITAPTRFMLDAIRSYFRVPSCASVVFNGRTLPPEDVAVARRRQAVSVGRLWDEAKGLTTLFDISSPVPILVAGEDRSEDGSQCAIAPHVQYVGTLGEEEILKLFRQSSVYICTSLYEPFGLAPLEAALCGCAVVARDLPSLREVWGDTALYFKTEEELSKCLQQSLMSESELKVWQSAAQQRAGTFTAKRMTYCYLELYGQLISRTRPHVDMHQELASNAA